MRDAGKIPAAAIGALHGWIIHALKQPPFAASRQKLQSSGRAIVEFQPLRWSVLSAWRLLTWQLCVT